MSPIINIDSIQNQRTHTHTHTHAIVLFLSSYSLGLFTHNPNRCDGGGGGGGGRTRRTDEERVKQGESLDRRVPVFCRHTFNHSPLSLTPSLTHSACVCVCVLILGRLLKTISVMASSSSSNDEEGDSLSSAQIGFGCC